LALARRNFASATARIDATPSGSMASAVAINSSLAPALCSRNAMASSTASCS
jgi:hypothetical protein